MSRTGMLLISTLVVVFLSAACARQPAMTTASVPPPSTSPTPTATIPAPGKRADAIQPVSQPGAVTLPAAPSTPATRPAPREFVAMNALRDINFDFDKYAIRPADAKVLDANADWLKTNKNNLVLIEGHCDERGTDEYNLSLGERRAKATMNYLVARGVAATRITVLSYGEHRPVCSDHNEACWAKNRRAHFLIKAQ